MKKESNPLPKNIKKPTPPPAPPVKKNPGINIKITSRVK
jgi:hypothetical protein